MTAIPHWAIWRWTPAGDKWGKVPYQTRPSRRGKWPKAKNNDPETWGTYTEAVSAQYDDGGFDGIGFMLLGSRLVMFDLDDCRDPTTGVIAPWALALVARADSYTEVTVSGTGLRIIGTGDGPKVQRKQPVDDGTVETYRNCERFVVVTNLPIPEAPMRLANLDALADEVVAERDAAKAARGGGGAERKADDTLLDLDHIIQTGDASRWNGDRSRAVFYVACEMLRQGKSPHAVIAVLLDRTNGISEHIYDQTNAEAYAKKQASEAAKEVAKEASASGLPPFDRVVVERAGEEVYWRITIGGEEIRLDASAVLHQQPLIDHCFKYLGISWPNLSRAAWSKFVNRKYAEAEKRIVEDLSPQDEFREHLHEFLTNRSRGDVRDDVLTGRPYEDQDRGWYEFRIADFAKFLRREASPSLRLESRTKVGARLAAMGGTSFVGKIRGKNYRLWKVPARDFESLPEAPLPSRTEVI